MITIEKPFDFQITYDLSHIGSKEEIVFFDIETTGFSPAASSLYLIGAVSFENNGWILHQWFASSWSEEKDILKAFFTFLQGFHILVHFNGDGFDIPYLTKCAKQYHMEVPFPSLESFDILKKIRSHKKLLQMDSLRQKAVEQFLQISREDTYSGGELIPIYERYSKNREERLLELLLLHNEDDLKGMPQILPILTYHDFTYDEFIPTEYYQNKSGTFLFFTGEFSYEFPKSFSYELENKIQISFEQNTVIAKIPMHYGEYRFYFPDYKNYYFLPEEDRAIHKKLAGYVEKDHRIPANASNCYTKMEGLFLPCPGTNFAPLFFQEEKCKNGFVRYEDTEDFRTSYLKSILSSL